MSLEVFALTPQQLEAVDPLRNIWVAANAGSGKTHVLVQRVVRLLLAGAEPAAILCITYTKAAAAEMSARLFEKLGSWIALSDAELNVELTTMGMAHVSDDTLVVARRLFTRALETPGGLKIQTIHAFCEKLLHLFPVEAGLAPGFEVLDDRRMAELREQSIRDVLRDAEKHPASAVGAAFPKIVAYSNAEQFDGLIRQFLNAAKGLRNILASDIEADGFSSILKQALGLPLESSVETSLQDILAIDRDLYHAHGQNLATHKAYYDFDAATLMKRAAAAPQPLAILRELYLRKDQSPRVRLLYSKAFQAQHPQTASFIEREMARLVRLIIAYDLHVRIEVTAALFTLSQAVHYTIESHKRRHGLYDFDDLISRTAKLLTNARAAQWVLYKLDAGLQHVLVDEAQDTSQAQWNIVSALSAEFFSGAGRAMAQLRSLFVVGDRKQSIYSFQGADAAAFSAAQDNFRTQISTSGEAFHTTELSISYRSSQRILDAVDAVFPPANKLQLGFSEDDREERTHQSNRLKAQGVVEIWPLYEWLGKEEHQPWLAPVDREERNSPRRRLASDIAIAIKSWIGRRVIAARGRTVRPDDILILLQTRGPLFSMLISELRRAGVPVAGADRLNLRASLAVQDLLMLAQFMVLPQDDYALACILKSPLVPKVLTEDQLFELAYGRANSLWNKLQAGKSANAELLNQWQQALAAQGPYEFFAQVLTDSRQRILSRLGSEADDATHAFLDAALEYELEHGQSLAGFLHWFTATETTIKREMEKNSGEVRLMTVHGAKGLEANIVFLPDAATMPNATRQDNFIFIPDHAVGAGVPLWRISGLTTSDILEGWKEAQSLKTNQERNRLFYVAMTRACDELYICGTLGKAKKLDPVSWYSMALAALASPEEEAVYLGPPHENSAEQILQSAAREILPDWATTPAEFEAPQRIHGLTHLTARDQNKLKNYDAKAAKRGIAIHALLQDLPDVAPAKRQAYVARKGLKLGLTETDVVALAELIANPALAAFFGPESRAEADIQGRLADGRRVSGRVDRIVILPHEILVLDYKSDHFVPETLAADHQYSKQLALYAELLGTAYPNHQVRAALLWTQTARLQWLSPEVLSRALDLALAEITAEAP